MRTQEELDAEILELLEELSIQEEEQAEAMVACSQLIYTLESE
tara:strand:+ start:254 stop:382 length:129 start_codon:yes stop_codon:yes gene_type:complete